MSIHQPRYSIFKLFDTLSLLSRGAIVYHGVAYKALEYFQEQGTCVYVCTFSLLSLQTLSELNKEPRLVAK